jgi:hypothetical protein
MIGTAIPGFRYGTCPVCGRRGLSSTTPCVGVETTPECLFGCAVQAYYTRKYGGISAEIKT